MTGEQAVTKWERDAGIPDIENIMAISALFDISIDELLSIVEIRSLECDSIELDIKAPNAILEDVAGTVEINCNLDMEVICHSLNGEVAINQVSATSKIYVPENVAFSAIAKGVGTSISYEKDGKQTEAFSVPEAENIIELNGIKSELVICTNRERG
ncbi:MAG: helix-turn-helix transcriptional regulator [Lachnospiraceae bacterium]|nr:helix-turn-helix transcriptional regulator [Lachnospiraceae bacterium]